MVGLRPILAALSSPPIPRYRRANSIRRKSPCSVPKPPFRADHVGSILRCAAIKDARAKREKGEITAAQLKEVEDREIDKIVRKQEEVGLKLATDGEYRRSWWHMDFYWGLTGVEKIRLPHGIKFHGVETRPEGYKITGRIDFPSDHPMLEHFKYLKAHTRVTPKMCIPAPTVMHFRTPKDGIPKSVYPDLDGYFADLGKAYAKAVKAFYDAGCRYLQFDDTAWSYLCSTGRDGGGARTHADGGQPAADLPGHGQHRAGGQTRRHDHHHPCLPRQFQIHLGGGGRLRAGRRAASWRA